MPCNSATRPITAEACIQTHGGFGFAEAYDIERKFRETRRYHVASIQGYGGDTAYAPMRAYDMLVQAESGLCAVTGTPETPSKVGFLPPIPLPRCMRAGEVHTLAALQPDDSVTKRSTIRGIAQHRLSPCRDRSGLARSPRPCADL